MKSQFIINRRTFLKRLGAAGLAAPMITRDLLATPPSQTLRHASFGAAGMAAVDVGALTANEFVKLIAVAEVDRGRMAKLKEKFPDVKVYQDWRVMLDKEHKNLDSVNVSTPDHMHAPMVMSAMQLGLHVYGQKPLTHDIYEARQLKLFARRQSLVTQMGIQIHSHQFYRQAVKVIQKGVIGKVKEVHTWSQKKWGDPAPRPDRRDPVPPELDWDLWLGVSAERPFIGNGYYHPVNWRRRLDFGTGTLGDMGCHIYDPIFNALALTAPISVRSEGPPPNQWNWSIDAVIHYVFPGTRFTEGNTVHVTWYDGDQRPPKDVLAPLGSDKVPGQGSVFIGTRGFMVLPHVGKLKLLPEKQFKDYPLPQVPEQNHWTQFAETCRGKGKTSANFDYAGPLTEVVLLGTVAVRFPKTTLEWDAAELKFTNLDEANQTVRRKYRKGWKVQGL